MKTGWKKRLMSLLLAAAMAVSLLPGALGQIAWAMDYQGVTITNQVTDSNMVIGLGTDKTVHVWPSGGNTTLKQAIRKYLGSGLKQNVRDNNAGTALATATGYESATGKLIVHDGFTTTENALFDRFIGLTEITLPNTLTSIGTWNFSSCPSLKTVTFEPGSGITALNNNGVEHNMFRWDLGDNWEGTHGTRAALKVKLPDGLKNIPANMFLNAKLEEVDIPLSVTKIENGAFRPSEKYPLETLTIGGVENPDNVNWTGFNVNTVKDNGSRSTNVTNNYVHTFAFQGTYGTQATKMLNGMREYLMDPARNPNRVVFMPSCELTPIANVDGLPSGVTDQGAPTAYSGGTVTTWFDVGYNDETYGTYAAVDSNGAVHVLGSTAAPDYNRTSNVGTPDANLPYSIDLLTSGDGLGGTTNVQLNNGKFPDMPGNGYDGNSKKHEGDFRSTAFWVRDNTILRNMLSPTVENGASKRRDLVIHEGITQIGWNATTGYDVNEQTWGRGGTWGPFCDLSIGEAYLPASLTHIADWAFTIDGKYAKYIYDENGNVIDFVINGPRGIHFAENGKLQRIGYGAFQRYAGTALTIPNTVREIAAYAFSSSMNLEQLTFERISTLETIGNDAFGTTKELKSVTIPASVSHIGPYAFAGDKVSDSIFTKLETITLEGDVGFIGGNAFANMPLLKEIHVKPGTTVDPNVLRNSPDAVVIGGDGNVALTILEPTGAMGTDTTSGTYNGNIEISTYLRTGGAAGGSYTIGLYDGNDAVKEDTQSVTNLSSREDAKLTLTLTQNDFQGKSGGNYTLKVTRTSDNNEASKTVHILETKFVINFGDAFKTNVGSGGSSGGGSYAGLASASGWVITPEEAQTEIGSLTGSMPGDFKAKEPLI